MHTIDFAQFGSNAGLIEELFSLYSSDRTLVDSAWVSFFDSLVARGENGTNGHHHGAEIPPQSPAAGNSLPANQESLAQIVAMVRLIDAYRAHGHFAAQIDPMKRSVQMRPSVPKLDLGTWGLSAEGPSIAVPGEPFQGTPGEIVEVLRRIYCGSIGFEFMHLADAGERAWWRERVETPPRAFQPAERAQMLDRLVQAEIFESELHRKFVGAKRFSLQGGDAFLAQLDYLLRSAATLGCEGAVIGMAHRGRLSVLANICNKPFEQIFSEFEDRTATAVLGCGDVKYHLGFTTVFRAENGAPLDLHLAPNPSHLEAVNPVVEGMVRALQDTSHQRDRSKVLPILVHGDAAFIGQGVVWETFNLSRQRGYETGGTIHLVINNQVGFTTDPSESRSSIYCSDPAKAFEVPVLHVNGDDVEACCRAARLAAEFRAAFHRDVVVDLVCHRKYGHNEGDDPTFTQPLLYAEIKERAPLYERYAQTLTEAGVVGPDYITGVVERFRTLFNAAQERQGSRIPGPASPLFGRLRDNDQATAVSRDRLEEVAKLLVSTPEGFVGHGKLLNILEKRIETLRQGSGIDWGFAEALAFGTLVQDGVPVRLSGQDCGRGTFSQRHLLLTDTEQSGVRYSVLEPLTTERARFEVYNSTLSEYAVMGFEFGYAATSSHSLVLWEGQFGDFANGAQIVIDQFLASSEVKWGQLSGLTLLLPHGYEGQGPEHSSARLERYLQLCADHNMTVCYPTTAAQHFHLLRRQGLSQIKRPLIVMTPKSLLRHSGAAASASQLTEGSFGSVLSDDRGSGKTPERAVIMSGKIYHDLAAAFEKSAAKRVRLIRVEQLYPFPEKELRAALDGVGSSECLWVQEEPQNMGAWTFVRPFLESLGCTPRYVGRIPAGTTATGSAKRHAVEQQAIVDAVLAFASGK